MQYACFNDRPLFGKRTGVGHYLDLIRAHWPSDATIGLRGLRESVGGRAATVSGPFVFPEVSALGSLELTPLASLSIPKGSGMVRGAALQIARRGYEQATKYAIKRASKRADFGVLFEPNHLPGAACRPCVATIHDLSVLELPAFHPQHRVDWWRRRMEHAMGTVDRCICVSQATADACVRVLGCDRDWLKVIPLASRWGSAPESWSASGVRAQLGVGQRYWVHVGTIEPRKNIVRLLDAYATLERSERARTKLVLCGRVGWGDAGFWESLCGHSVAEEVMCAGYADDAQVAALMFGSLGVLCPSHYEGFGLPTIEAMALGVPNVISNAPSLVEVVGGAAVRVDAGDTDGWAAAMMDLARGADSSAVEAGKARAGVYSWEATAKAHHDVFAGLVGGR